MKPCEVCGEREAVGLVVLEDGTALLCAECIADGVDLGLIARPATGGAA